MNHQELTFDAAGHPHIGDENAPDFGELGIENLGFETGEVSAVIEGRTLYGHHGHYRELEDYAAGDGIWADGYKIEDGEEETILEEIEEHIDRENDKWLRAYNARMDAISELSQHALVRQFGFKASQLCGPDGNPFGVETIAVLHAAAKAARELGRSAACRAMGIEDKGQTLSSMGVKVLFRAAAALQAELSRREAARPKPIRLGVSLQIPSLLAASSPPPRRSGSSNSWSDYRR